VCSSCGATRPSTCAPTAGAALTTAAGRRVVGRHAVVCAGEDVNTLLPALYRDEAPSLRLCKLQMMRLALPRAGGALTMPLTSGLSLRRYPLLAAACPEEHARMMRQDDEAADAEAERLGIHIIARPAGAVPRGSFGEALPVGPGATPRAAPAGLVPGEAVVGDSHQYAPAVAATAGPGGVGPPLDDVIDEGVTDAMLRVAGGMLGGVAELVAGRRGSDAGRRGAVGGADARLLQQWQGVYLQHADGVLSAALALSPGASSANERGFTRLAEEDAAREAGGGAAVVRVLTGIGGKGMTMGPALGEEAVAQLWR
jgi:hypothetical protein